MSDGKLIPSHAARYLRVTELREKARQLALTRAAAERIAAQAEVDLRLQEHDDAVLEAEGMLAGRTDGASLALITAALRVSGNAITFAEGRLEAARSPEDDARSALQDAAQRRLAASRWTSDMKRAAILEHERREDRAAADRTGGERSASHRGSERKDDS